jgi:hypothetical protein
MSWTLGTVTTVYGFAAPARRRVGDPVTQVSLGSGEWRSATPLEATTFRPLPRPADLTDDVTTEDAHAAYDFANERWR